MPNLTSTQNSEILTSASFFFFFFTENKKGKRKKKIKPISLCTIFNFYKKYFQTTAPKQWTIKQDLVVNKDY